MRQVIFEGGAAAERRRAGSGTPTTQILISLRNADPAALTALASLRRYLGYGDRLSDLRRRVLWELSGPEGEPQEAVVEAVRRSGELWNPNKERALVRAPGGPVADIGAPLPDEGRWESVLAWDPDRDLDRKARALRPWRDRGWRLRRGTLWSLQWQADDPAERLRLTEAAVICHGAKEGLLVHPHLEDSRRIASQYPVPWLPKPKEEE